MPDVTVSAEPIEITTDEGVVIRVGGTTTITGELSGPPTGGAGGFLSGSYPNPGVNTEALQDAVGGMAGQGLVYDDTAGDLVWTGAAPRVTAPSDGTTTTLTVDGNGRLSANIVEVLDGAGGGEEGRATIVLPDPADVEGQAVMFVVPTGVPGPTIKAPVHAPGIFGDLADYSPELNFATTPTTYRWTVSTPDGIDTYDAVLDEDYADSAALGVALFGAVLASGDVTLDIDGLTVPQTELDGEVDTILSALVTVGTGPDWEIAVEAVSGPDTLGLETLTSWPGEIRTINGIDDWAKGNAHTHLNRDAGGPHGAIVVAGPTEWRWVVYPHDRAELVGFVTPAAAGGFFDDTIQTNVGQALEYLHNRIADPALANDGDVLTWNATAEQWQAEEPAAGAGTADALSNVAADRIIGRIAAGSGNSEELTASEVRTLINVADGATATPLSSSTPAALGTAAAGVSTSASRSDHVHAAPTTLASVATSSIVGRSTAGTGASENLTASQARTILNVADGAAALGTATPSAPGTAAAGSATTAAKADHVHPRQVVTTAGQDEGAAVTATSATTLLDAALAIPALAAGDSVMIICGATFYNGPSSGGSKQHTITLEIGGQTMTMTTPAFAASTRAGRVQVDLRMESTGSTNISASLVLQNIAANVVNAESTQDFSVAKTCDIKGNVASGGDQSITATFAVVRHFPA